jgi:hypothetical protein
MEMYQRIRNRVRCYLLWLRKEFKASLSTCEYCGKRIAYPCSTADLKRLCNSCAGYVCIAAECKHAPVDATAVSLWDNSDEEFPRFDTYPSPAPMNRRVQ